MTQLLDSEQFVSSRSVTKLLSYCVDAVLAGDEETLKETTIGVYCFGRAPGYDTKQDPIVRVTARRLRSKLDLYYEKDTANHKLRIVLPKGTYIPRFDYRSQSISVAVRAAALEPISSWPTANDVAPTIQSDLPVVENLAPTTRDSWSKPAVWSLLTFALLICAAITLPRSYFHSSEWNDQSQDHPIASQAPAEDANSGVGSASTAQENPTKSSERDALLSRTAPAADRAPGDVYSHPIVARTDDIAASVEPRL